MRGLIWNIVSSFLDDALVIDKGIKEHLANLRSGFARFREVDQKFKLKKCALFQRRVKFLGRQVSPHGSKLGDSCVDIVRDWAAPRSTKDVKRFLGSANYHRGFIAGYAQLAFPLYCLIGKKPFISGQEQQAAFGDLKKALTSPPVLALPSPHRMASSSWTQSPRPRP